jgi:putative transposase
MNEEQIRQRIQKIIGGRQPYEVASWPRPERNDVIRRLKEEELSIRQIERATGIARGIVAKC